MYKSHKIFLVAFGTNDLKKSIRRLRFQAQNSKFYDDIKIFNNQLFDKDMEIIIKELIKNKKERGYGYWIWKPYFILKVLEEIEDGDIVNYMDIGCHIVKENSKRFYEYIDLISNEKKWLLPFQYKIENISSYKNFAYPNREEYKFTKSDLLNHFGFLNDKSILETPQYWAGNFFIKKTDTSIKFISEWLNMFYEHFDLIDDTPSKIINHKDFIENRHDQSVFSILCKKNNLESLSAYECDWAILNHKITWNHNMNSPILAKRDLKYDILKRFIFRLSKTFERIKKKLFG